MSFNMATEVVQIVVGAVLEEARDFGWKLSTFGFSEEPAVAHKLIVRRFFMYFQHPYEIKNKDDSGYITIYLSFSQSSRTVRVEVASHKLMYRIDGSDCWARQMFIDMEDILKRVE